MKKIIALIASAVMLMALALVSVPATAAPAEVNPVVSAKDTTWGGKVKAKAWGTSVSHAGDDSGYTRDIHVVCNTGKHVYLAPGEGTFAQSSEEKSCSLSGVDRIIVAYNQTVYCKNLVPPYQNRYFYTGTTYFGSNQTWKCYDQWPL